MKRKDLNSDEVQNVKVSKNPTTVVAANGQLLANEEATVYVRDLDLFVTVLFVKYTPAVLSLGKLCDDHGYYYHWTSGQKPQLIKKGRRIECNTAIYVPFVVFGVSTNSSSSSSFASLTSSSQEAVILTQHPAPVRCETVSDEVRGDPLRGLPDRLEEFKENHVDDSVFEHRDAPSSSHELSSEPRAKALSGKHSIFIHFPKDGTFDIRLRITIIRALCRKTHWHSRAKSGKLVVK